MKPTYRKSWHGNLLMWSYLTLDPSFKVKRGWPNLKVFITCLLLVLEVCNVKPTYRISWPMNVLMSDLTFGSSFKVKQWFTGFGKLSFRWIQICISSPMCRSSYMYFYIIVLFYYATIAYHVGLNAVLGWPQGIRPTSKKNRHL